MLYIAFFLFFLFSFLKKKRKRKKRKLTLDDWVLPIRIRNTVLKFKLIDINERARKKEKEKIMAKAGEKSPLLVHA
jgi:hypothetical protein